VLSSETISQETFLGMHPECRPEFTDPIHLAVKRLLGQGIAAY
jgi:hypothetical protein